MVKEDFISPKELSDVEGVINKADTCCPNCTKAFNLVDCRYICPSCGNQIEYPKDRLRLLEKSEKKKLKGI